MTLDQITYFTPYKALIGGSLIGVSAVLFLWLNGRIAGISGLFHHLYTPGKPLFNWRFAFLIGLVLGGFSYFIIPGIQFSLRTDYPIYLLLCGGFFVGFGTRMGPGCTSGHGVCGIARLSKRSVVATIVFMLSALVTVFILRHILGVH